MKTLAMTLMSLMAATVPAVAAVEESGGEGLGLMAMCFIGFGVLVVMFQFVPAVMLLAGIIKGIMTPAGKKADEAPHS